ncbi:hypothetical protein DFH08DRAFT_963156 [Mycena albidolilacea]|uniref:Hydrophobin n=1 Tax=Mycena albidolilacea TaxID=1033008 RepID=A0AAD6ZWP1_9AGAR|nr:hypothetical protein DFH08DRAFT_963156 [Mycena albidolilacea]
MFSKFSVVVASVLITLAAAIPNGTPPPPVTTPDSPQCCASVVPASSTAASRIAATVGLDASWSIGNTTVICDAPKEEWGGLIAINCIPITL